MKGTDPAMDAREKAFSRLATRYISASPCSPHRDAACLQPADAVCLQMLTVKILLLQTWFRPQAYFRHRHGLPLDAHMLHSILQVQGRIEAFSVPLNKKETAGGLSWREGPLQKGGGGGQSASAITALHSWIARSRQSCQ